MPRRSRAVAIPPASTSRRLGGHLLAGLLLAAALPVATLQGQRAAGAPQPGLLVLNKGEATASLLSLADGRTIASFPVGDGPHEVSVSPDGRMAVAANYGGAQGPGHSLTVLDLRSRTAIATIELGEYRRPHGISWLPDGKRVVVTSELAQAVVIVDVAAGKIERAIKTGQAGHLLTLSADGKFLWTANVASGSVTRIDLTSGTVTRTVKTGARPEASDVTRDGKEFWVADGQLNYLTVFDATSLDSIAAVKTGDYPNRLHFTRDGRRVLVSNAKSSSVYLYDSRSHALVDSIVFPYDSLKAKPTMLERLGRSSVPLGILVAPDGQRVWIALAAMDQIAEVDLASRRVTRTLTAGREPDGMAFVPNITP